MAWITKNSAGATIERRDQPYLTDAMKQRIREVYLPRYENSRGALLPTLHTIQHEYGWIPPQALMEIADFLGLQSADVLDTASFYEEFWLQRKGKNLVAVCRSIACECCGNREITQACARKLGIEPGETTDDDQFTLVELECLGSCGTAPVALINETLHENLTPEKIERLLDEARAHGNHHHHGHH